MQGRGHNICLTENNGERNKWVEKDEDEMGNGRGTSTWSIRGT